MGKMRSGLNAVGKRVQQIGKSVLSLIHRPSLGFGVGFGVAATISMYQACNTLAERYPNQFHKYFGTESIVCEREVPKKITRGNDVTLEDVVRQTVFTTRDDGNPFPSGFMYLTPMETGSYAGERVSTPQRTHSAVCAAINSSIGRIPVMVGDEGEGGYVTRVDLGLPPAEVLGLYYEGKVSLELQSFPSLLTNDGKLPSEKVRKEKIKDLYDNAAATLRDLEVGYVFGPVLDTVRNVEESEEINIMAGNDRSFSSNPKTVIDLAKLYIDAMHGQGIKVIGKHYMGVGYTTIDPHKGVPTLEHMTASEETAAAMPFTALARQLDGIMVTHVLHHDRNVPDTFSPAAYKHIREQLGFKGIIITDDLYMGAVEERYKEQGETWAVDAVMDALAAGADGVILKYPQEMPQIISAVAHRMQTDKAFEAQVNASFERLMQFKGIKVEGSSEIDVLVKEVSEEGVHWVRKNVEEGETLVGLVAAENPAIASRKKDGRPYVVDAESYAKIEAQFIALNGITPREMRARKQYYLPDFTGDGIVFGYEDVVQQHVPVQQETSGNLVTVRFPRDSSFYKYLAGEVGSTVKDDDGRFLPLTAGPLSSYYYAFKQNNPGVKSVNKLQAGVSYVFLDINRNGKIDFKDPYEAIHEVKAE